MKADSLPLKGNAERGTTTFYLATTAFLTTKKYIKAQFL